MTKQNKSKRRYMKPSLDRDFMERIAEFIEKHPELGYRSVSHFLDDAARRRADELHIFELRECTRPPNFTEHIIDFGAPANPETIIHRMVHSRVKGFIREADDCVWFMDRRGKILDVNKKCEELCGKPREQIIGRSFAELANQDLSKLPEFVATFSNVLMGNEVTFPCKGEINMLVRFRAIMMSGKVIGIVATGKNRLAP